MKSTVRRILISIIVVSVSPWAISAVANAGEFSVQIGAFREAPSGFAEAATRIGPLATSQTSEGLTRFQIGKFDSEAAAETARTALVGAGYADAFVVQKRVARRSEDAKTATNVTETLPRPAAKTAAVANRSTGNDPLAGLSASLRSQVVILDGAYYVKDGDDFTPLADALAAENQ